MAEPWKLYLPTPVALELHAMLLRLRLDVTGVGTPVPPLQGAQRGARFW